MGREGSGGNELLPESLESGQWQNDLVSIQERWKLSNQIIEGAQRCVEASARIVFAHRLRWSQVQPLLVHGWTVESTMLAERIADHLGIELTGVRLASERVSRPIEEWNPNPLIDGGDLIRAGLRPSPVFGKLLSRARALQLDNELVDRISAVAWLQERIGELNQ